MNEPVIRKKKIIKNKKKNKIIQAVYDITERNPRAQGGSMLRRFERIRDLSWKRQVFLAACEKLGGCWCREGKSATKWRIFREVGTFCLRPVKAWDGKNWGGVLIILLFCQSATTNNRKKGHLQAWGIKRLSPANGWMFGNENAPNGGKGFCFLGGTADREG